MTRAEEEAYKIYPEEKTIIGAYSTGRLMVKDVNAEKRNCFIDGYEKAEKDLMLTWEDIKTINQMLSAVEDEDPDDEYFELSEQRFYEEVLKRFNEWKQEH